MLPLGLNQWKKKTMKKNNITNFLIVTLTLLSIAFLVELNVQEQRYEREVYELTERLNVKSDELDKAKWHIEMLNKEREAE